MNRLSNERRAAIIRCLIDGVSIRATCRIVGAAKGTILKLVPEIGEAALEYQRSVFVDLPCKNVQCDEIWAFVASKERNTPPELRGQGKRGDVWTWTAICADTKLIPCWHVGARDADAAFLFMADLAARLKNRVQLTTDGYGVYLNAVANAWPWDGPNGVDYAMLVKHYGMPLDNERTSRRYSPSQLLSTEKKVVFGDPDPALINTSFAERANLTMRMNMRRFTRLTNAFSKKVENHLHSVSLHMLAYNFAKPHGTLTRANGGIHCTPAMAIGLESRVWTVDDIVALLSK